MIDGLDEPSFRSLHNSVHFMIGGDAQSFNWHALLSPSCNCRILTLSRLGWKVPLGTAGRSSVPTTLFSYVRLPLPVNLKLTPL